jgi:quinoprotein glucose dehydrogenase
MKLGEHMRKAHQLIFLSIVFVLTACSSEEQAAVDVAGADWPTYGQDAGGMRFSGLDQIDSTNVQNLEVAWVYRMKPDGLSEEMTEEEAAQAQALAELGIVVENDTGFEANQVTPLVVDGRMYLSTPYNRVVALDPESGEEVWVYEAPEGMEPARRGVEYWPGDDEHGARILFGTGGGTLMALEADTGQPVVGFADEGILNLKTPDVFNSDITTRFGGGYSMTSTPLVYKNLVFTGAATGESPIRGSRGDVRAWDVVTGERVWTFHSVPREGEFGYDTWEEGSAEWRRGVNVWGFMTVDEERGILYLPFGAPSWDRYGGDREGLNLFSSSIVAVDAETGEYIWHFQLTHHDIWDYDAEGAPALIDIRKDGELIPAVVAINKSGLLFILNRETGEPIYEVEERPVPVSQVEGEVSWPTQPFPVTPEPISRNSFSMEDIATVTPELEDYCRNWIEDNNMQFGGPYIPTGYEPTILFPGYQGGSNWSGVSYNPESNYIFINTAEMGQVYQLRNTEEEPGATGGGLSSRFYWEEEKLMCQEPPWGQLTAVDASTGEIAWRAVLGVSDNVPEEVSLTGRPNIGGSTATAGNLVFIGATDDSRFRAFDASTGELLWEVMLEASAHAAPITYLGEDGKQYVVVASTGGSFLRSPVSSDAVTAWKLPD